MLDCSRCGYKARRSISSRLPFTSVVSLHTNEYGCGVAKFSKQLAERIGKEFVGFGQPHRFGDFPLFSLKMSELDMLPYAHFDGRYGVFWHDAGDFRITKQAEIVYYADPSLGSPGLWCPSLIPARKRAVRLFTFGMAHKLQIDRYKRVRELLDAAQQPYLLRVSVGIHEGTSLSDATQHFRALREVMGSENVTILGILSDEGVSEELYAADYVLSFFENGARANNTTVHTALEHGCRIISNLDDNSPEAFSANLLDLGRIQRWPTPLDWTYLYSWDHLLGAMKAVCDKSRSAIAS